MMTNRNENDRSRHVTAVVEVYDRYLNKNEVEK